MFCGYTLCGTFSVIIRTSRYKFNYKLFSARFYQNDIIFCFIDERSLFQTFLILIRYGAKDYVNLLLESIEQYKPSLTAINAAKRFRLHTQH